MTSTAAQKSERVSVLVSKTNANRVKSGTHSVAAVLELQGYVVLDNLVQVGARLCHVDDIDLVSREKSDERVLRPVELDAPNG